MRTPVITLLIFFLVFAGFFPAGFVMAQCATTISTFPYHEDFENSNGNWTASSNLHWEWGTPFGKTRILTAGSGAKCWLAGGLTTTDYAGGTSYLISPCFDF